MDVILSPVKKLKGTGLKIFLLRILFFEEVNGRMSFFNDNMNAVLDWYQKGMFQKDNAAKERMKEHLDEHPIIFGEDETAQKNIFQNIISTIQ